MFGRKKEKTQAVKKQTAKKQTAKKQTVKSGGAQTVKKQTVKSGGAQTTKKQTVKKETVRTPADENAKLQEKREKVYAKLVEIEKEAGLEQARDSVGKLEDEKIAEHIELLLKIMRSGE